MKKKEKSRSFYVKIVKRTADFIIGFCAMPFLLVVVIFVGIAIKFEDGGKQRESGKTAKFLICINFVL